MKTRASTGGDSMIMAMGHGFDSRALPNTSADFGTETETGASPVPKPWRTLDPATRKVYGPYLHHGRWRLIVRDRLRSVAPTFETKEAALAEMEFVRRFEEPPAPVPPPPPPVLPPHMATNEEKNRARRALMYEVERGRIVRQSCDVCGKPDAHGHHEDYSKPLDVRWLCPAHHTERHHEMRRKRGKFRGSFFWRGKHRGSRSSRKRP